MSTINNAVFGESDDDRDPDFVPEESSESSDEEAKTAEVPELSLGSLEAERSAKEAARASLWANFQSSVGASSGRPHTTTRPVKHVKVVEKYLFAGEEVSDVIEVPEDSEEAKRWPLWNSASFTAVGTSSTHEGKDQADSKNADSGTKTSEDLAPSTKSATNTAVADSSASVLEPPRRRAGPRKPKTTLVVLPTTKPKKITTLDKSAMDWRSHVTQGDASGEAPGVATLSDELESNRKSGGYLEKVAFLERVENRREQLFEESRKKRRKG